MRDEGGFVIPIHLSSLIPHPSSLIPFSARPPAQNDGTLATAKHAQHRQAPAIAPLWFFDYADTITITARDFDAARHAGHFQTNDPFTAHRAAPGNDFGREIVPHFRFFARALHRVHLLHDAARRF